MKVYKDAFLILNWQSKRKDEKKIKQINTILNFIMTEGNNYTILLLTHLGVISPVPTF